MTNPYETLGVPKDATKDTIRRAYRKRAQKVHPDKAGDSGKEEFQRISSAYALLNDDTARARYDSSGQTGSADGNLPAELANLLLSVMARVNDVDCTDVVGTMRAELLGQRQSIQRQKSQVESSYKKLERAATKVKAKAGADNLLQAVLTAEALKGRLLIGQLEEAIKRVDALMDLLEAYSYEVSPSADPWQSTSTFFNSI